MKKIIVLICFMVLNNWLGAQVVPTNSLIGRWEFNGNANDASGTSNHGVVTGATLTQDRCGNANSAYHFNGTNNYIQMPFTGPLLNNSRSISFWCRSTNTFTNSPRSIFTYGNGALPGGCFQIVYNYCTSGIGLEVGSQSFTSQNNCLADGNWHHVVATYQSCSCSYITTRIYIDGALIPMSCNVIGTSQFLNTNANCPLNIGKGACGLNRFFQGDLDDFYLYNRALDPSEVRSLFNVNAQCLISGNTIPCEFSNTTYSTVPVVGGTYTWILPNGWTGTPTTNSITAVVGSSSGTITVNITTTCGVITRVLPVNPVALGLVATGNVTFCTNMYPNVVLSASVTNPATTNVNWPTLGPGLTHTITPSSTTNYQVIATDINSGCSVTSNMLVTVSNACCTLAPTAQQFMSGVLTAPGSLSGPVIINSNVTINGSGNFTFNAGDFIMAPGVQITVSNSVNLVLQDAHLFTCGPILWKGISVQNGGNVTSAPGPNGLSSFIEDAEIAIHLNGISTGHATSLLNLDGVIFNKNYIGIKIENSALNTIPIFVRSCVFTSRNLPFSILNWPSTSTLPGGLRFATTAALSGLSAPFLNQYVVPNILPWADIKSPLVPGSIPIYQGVPNMSWAGIQIQNIGTAIGVGVDLMASAGPQANQFNLFDYHRLGIDVKDASLTTYNNAFQNIYVWSGLPILNPNFHTDYGSPWFTTPIACNAICINHFITGTLNARLNLSPPAGAPVGTHNRFWDFAVGINAKNVYELNVQKATFRCGGHAYGRVGSSSYDDDFFEMAIRLKTNRWNYTIDNNQFNNLTNGVKLTVITGPYSGIVYNSFTYSNGNAVFSGPLSISQNYFGPQLSSATPLSSQNYFLSPIYLVGNNNFLFNGPVLTNQIQSNRMDRCLNGVDVTWMKDYSLYISNNDINLIDDPQTTPSWQQAAVKLNTNLGRKYVVQNNLYSTGYGQQTIQLVQSWNNVTPEFRCNTLRDAYTGFFFWGNNTGVWEGNSMTNTGYGLHLENNGIIGPQGNSTQACGNSWSGTSILHTYVGAPSSALNSPLYLTSGFPTANGGSGVTYNTVGAINHALTPYTCMPGNYPNIPQYRSANGTDVATGIENTNNLEESFSVYPNPANNHLTITGQLESEQLQAEIYDLSGKLVYSGNFATTGYKAHIDLSLEAGMYLLTITDQNNKKMVKKLVVTK